MSDKPVAVVTGGAGFIGSHLVARCPSRSHCSWPQRCFTAIHVCWYVSNKQRIVA